MVVLTEVAIVLIVVNTEAVIAVSIAVLIIAVVVI